MCPLNIVKPVQIVFYVDLLLYIITRVNNNYQVLLASCLKSTRPPNCQVNASILSNFRLTPTTWTTSHTTIGGIRVEWHIPWLITFQIFECGFAPSFFKPIESRLQDKSVQWGCCTVTFIQSESAEGSFKDSLRKCYYIPGSCKQSGQFELAVIYTCIDAEPVA